MERTLQSIVDEAAAQSEPVNPLPSVPVNHMPVQEPFHRKEILEFLHKNPIQPSERSLHMGTAGIFNLAIAAINRPEHILFVDANPSQERYWKEVFSLFAQCTDAETFKMKYDQRLARYSNELTYQNGDSTFVEEHGLGFKCENGEILLMRHMYPEKTNFDFLDDPEVYSYFHQLAKNNKMATLTTNLIQDPERCKAVGLALRNNDYRIDTAYWSNIGSYSQPHRLSARRSKTESMYGDATDFFPEGGVVYCNKGYYEADNENHNVVWAGFSSQSERDSFQFSALPVYERFLENTSALGGSHTFHMHANANDKFNKRQRYPLIISEGPLRRLPEQVEARKNARDPSHPDWQVRIGEPDNGEISR